MDNMTAISIGATLGLIGLAIVISIIAGVMSLINGKQDYKKIITVLIPFIVFGITYNTIGTLADAGIATMLVMLGLMALITLLSGMKSTFNF